MQEEITFRNRGIRTEDIPYLAKYLSIAYKALGSIPSTQKTGHDEIYCNPSTPTTWKVEVEGSEV